MIVHIGFDLSVCADEVVAILSRESIAPCAENRAFLSRAREAGSFFCCEEGERSYVLVAEGEQESVYASAINTQTLKKRFDSRGLYDMENQPIIFEGE